MSDNNILYIIILILYYILCLGSVPERMYRKNTPPIPPASGPRVLSCIYTETLNCSELFASIKLFGVINKSFNFV